MKKRCLSASFTATVVTGVFATTLFMASAQAVEWPFSKDNKSTPSPANAAVHPAPVGPAPVDNAPVQRSGSMPASFAPILKKVNPSVVTIFTTQKVRIPDNARNPLLEDPFFRRFFGVPEEGQAPMGPRNGPSRQQPSPKFREQQGLGSGVIVSKDGYILTNNHVVDVADEVKVLMADGKKEFAAKIIGKDPKTDVAVIKVNSSDLPVITMTDSDQVQSGDIVLAIGNPFGIGQTATMGIVSALGRNLPPSAESPDMISDFIQTDAAINPGNSGGALVDAEGRLIGINTAILSRVGANIGIGFAVPINLARDIMNQLIQSGKVSRGFLGVGIQNVTPELAAQLNIKGVEEGAVVTQVTEGSAAQAAGIKEYDVITRINDKPVGDSRALRLLVTQLRPGVEVKIGVIRDGKELALTAKLKEATDESGGDAPKAEGGDEEGTLFNGVEISDLTPQLRQELNVPRTLIGVVITGIDQDAPAAHAGLRRGDVLTEIDRKPIKTVQDALRLGKQTKDGRVLVRVWRQGNSFLSVVEIQGKP